MAIEGSDTPVRLGEERAGKGPSFRSLAIAGLLLLVAGIIGGGWAASRYLADDAPTQTKVIDTANPGGALAAPAAAEPPAAAPQPLLAAPAGSAEGLAARVAELEQRLSRINLEANSVSGNSSRVEGLIVAFSVRRALDRGLPLDYLDTRLRLRFANDQPKAVETIIEASRDPVTLEQLHTDLDTLAPQLVGRGEGAGGSLWTGFRRELGELFVVRSAKTPSPRAADRLERARRHLARGIVGEAIKEIEAMPGAAAAEQWLIDARRYHEARRALDLIEAAAILEPRDSPAAAVADNPPAAPNR
ncbi:MAG TPA: hypothetical protein PKD99_05295 [Sphingopyxis sp.]|nr:hypothetical protein [Sphingopyxis sp.]